MTPGGPVRVKDMETDSKSDLFQQPAQYRWRTTTLEILFINMIEAMLINQPVLMPRSPHFLVTTYWTNKNAMLLRIRALREEPPAAQGMRPWMVPYLYHICVRERIRRKQSMQLTQTPCNIFCNNNSLFSFDFLVFNTKERSDLVERRGTESLDHRLRVKWNGTSG